ncbi:MULTISPECIES: DUF2141 domain-containing protein [unclassified Anabaena]|uniref:DUF2141 domain-containing protein n=1 Tax=unclassified Anabaena TaxID=2619674 RepID=UPI000833C79F|nr:MULTISPECIES: DUF2141 domain-containing protein [unclassified Anabaena]
MLKKITVGMMLLASVGNLAWLESAKASFQGQLMVNIDGLKNQQGQVCVNLFASSQGFPGDRQRVFQKQCAKISETPLQVSFNNLPAGSYAVAVIHDQNGDRTLNRNSLGMPTEGVGFSRNPVVRTQAPKFSETVVLVAGPNTNINIQMKYF